MLRRVGVLGVDQTRTFTITRIGEPLARLSTLKIRGRQLDGTMRVFDILAGETPTAVPGVGNLMFAAMVPLPFTPSDVAVINDGSESGTVYMRVTDDTGAEILYLAGVVDIAYALFMMSDVVFDMPDRNYAISVEVGH